MAMQGKRSKPEIRGNEESKLTNNRERTTLGKQTRPIKKC